MMLQLPIQLALVWRPYFSPLTVIAAGVLLAALAVFAAARAWRDRPALSVLVAAMRLALIAVVTLVLMGPSMIPPSTQLPGRPLLTIMLDTSASMQTRDVADESRVRFAADRWLSPRQLEALRVEYDVSVLGFAHAPLPLGDEALRVEDEKLASGRVSRIAACLADTVAALPDGGDGSAILLLSDGRDSDAEPLVNAARLAHAKSIAVHTVALGGVSHKRDLAVVALPAQPYLLAGEQGQIKVRVLQANADRMATRLTITCGDQVEQRDIAFAGSEPVALEWPVQHVEPGTYEYRIAVAPIDGEIEPSNNEQSVFIDVTNERLKVLVLDGEPFWDTKFLAHALRTDDRIGVTQVTQIAADRKETILTRIDTDQPTLPRTMEDLVAYDVIVLGKGLERLLAAEVAELLPRYVAEHGGRVIFARGQAYNPNTPQGRVMGRVLSVLEPVVWGRGLLHDQAMELEPAGRMHPSFVGAGGDAGIDRLAGQLPRFGVLPVIEREKASARVLARVRPSGASGAAGQPVLVTMPYNRGMVLAVLGEGMWRWRLVGRQQQELAGVFDRFWSATVRWMVLGSDYQPGQSMSLRLEQRSVQVGQEMNADVMSRAPLEPSVRAVVTAPDGSHHEAALRPVGGSSLRHRVTYTVAAPGVHTVTVMGALSDKTSPLTARFNAYEIDMERLYSSADPTAMKLLAQHSGGTALHPGRPDELRDVLDRYRAATIVPPQPHYVWDRGVILALILTWAGGEWLIRKRGGLL